MTVDHCQYRSFITFQSTHPRRVWRYEPSVYDSVMLVSIHTPTQGVTNIKLHFWEMRIVSIHTPTQGVTLCKDLLFQLKTVSIHTPTQGVTTGIEYEAKKNYVSIHTPTQGVTAMQRQWQTDMWFQSTHPRRVWLISRLRFVLNSCFNPHTHAGCDQILLDSKAQQVLFQSTHPRRVWHLLPFLNYADVQFQSTHPRRVWPISNNIL